MYCYKKYFKILIYRITMRIRVLNGNLKEIPRQILNLYGYWCVANEMKTLKNLCNYLIPANRTISSIHISAYISVCVSVVVSNTI